MRSSGRAFGMSEAPHQPVSNTGFGGQTTHNPFAQSMTSPDLV